MNHMVRTMAAFAAICCLAFGTATLAQQTARGSDNIASPGLWTLKASMPGEKVNHGAAVVNGKVYVFGGSNTLGASNETYVYDIATDSWTTAPATATLQTARISPMVEAVNGKVYVFGGYSQLAAPMRISSTVLEFDPATSLMATKSAMPTPVAGAGSFVMNGKIFILGGCGTGGWNVDMRDSIQIYDPVANTWSVSSSTLPVLIRSFGATILGDQVVIAGGWTKGSPSMIKGAWVGKVAGDAITWTAAPDYPAGELNRLSAGSSDSKIFFSGGQLLAASATTGKTYSFNLVTNTWEPLQDNPNAVHSSCSILYDGSGSMLLIGGRSSTAPALSTVSAMLTVTKPNMVVGVQKIEAKLMVNRSRKSPVEIINSGSGDLTWNAAIDPPSVQWVKLSSSSGTTIPDASSVLTVSIESKGLAAGTYTATLKLTSNDAQHATKDIPVSLNVQSEPIRDKKVLLEEFTGTWCGWCPYGVDSIHAMLSRYGNELAVISHHYGDPMQILDNPTIIFYLKGSYFPGGTMDRTKFAAEPDTIIGRTTWGKHLDEILSATPLAPVGISFLDKRYNSANKQMYCKVQVKFYEDVNIATKITLIQTESGLNWAQQKYAWPIPQLKPYFHEHVVRLMVPDHFGEELTSGPMTAGTTVEHEFSFTSNDSIADNSELVVIVEQNAGASIGPILQTYDEGLIDGITTDVEPSQAPEEYALLQNYPNPVFSGVTNISYSLPATTGVRVMVFDMLGRTVATLVDGVNNAGRHTVQWNTRNLNAGVYLCKLEAGKVTLTRNLTIVK